MSEEQIRRLQDIDFNWSPSDSYWEEMFHELLDHKCKSGDCKIPDDWPENPKLGTWVGKQRGARRLGKLSNERFRRLEEIDFVWNTNDAYWEQMFAALVEYSHKHGDCNVTYGWPENPQLATWVVTQRTAKKSCILSHERVQRLENIHFIWDARDLKWEEMFAALKKYQAHHGDCDVPLKWPERPELGRWVIKQRSRRHDLDNMRITRLEEIGFAWNTREKTWEEMFACLVFYKRKHGNCKVPDKWSENRTFSAWVRNQRSQKKAGTLDQQRFERLENIGFIWDLRDALWEERFAELSEYCREHCDCNVPANWPDNPKLGTWVKWQRKLKRAGMLTNQRALRLLEIGF